MTSKDGKGRKSSFFIIDKKEKKDAEGGSDRSDGEDKPVGERIADLMNNAKEKVAGKAGDEKEDGSETKGRSKDGKSDRAKDSQEEKSDKKERKSKKAGKETDSKEGGHSKIDQDELEGKAFKGTGGAFFNNDIDSAVEEKEKPKEKVKEEKKEAHEGFGGAMFGNDNPTEKEGKKDEELVEKKKKKAYSGAGGAMFANDTKDTKEKEVDPKEAKEQEKEAFSGVGGAFFNNDVSNVAPKKDGEGREDKDSTGEDKKDGMAEDNKGSTGEDRKDGTGKDNGEEDDKHVKIDEDKNENFSVASNNSSTFVPAVLANPCDESKIHDYRRDNLIEAEGFFYKKRIIFFCFWHKKYFVLLKDGTLVYHKCSGARFAKGKWNIREATNFQKMDASNSWHPYRFFFDVSGTELYFSYDTIEDRDYWYSKLEGASRSTG